ncbi:MAG TPA: tRNA-dihydrouridine synthase [Atribacteraceae bacterium]|nr:tRNA-dihydrouridine synthase [Atribacteraceae bacterium]
MNNSHIDISTTLAGVTMRTPFGVSPHNLDKPWFPGRKAAELFLKYVEAGAGYIYIPALVPGAPTEAEKNLDFPTLFKNQNYVGRWMKVPVDSARKEVIAHIYTAKNLFNYLSWGKELLDEIRPSLPKNVPVIAQVLVHDLDPAKWAEQTKRVADLGVDIIELNTGCPVGAMCHMDAKLLPPEAKWGMMMGTAPDVFLPVLEACIRATDVPVGFKLTPEVGYPRMLYITEEAQKIGARFVVTTHKYFVVPPPDIWNGGRGKYPGVSDNANILSDIGGPMLRFSMYKATALISKNIPGIETFAGGGITSPEHVAEAIMLGANACQTLTGIVLKGIDFIERSNSWLKKYMSQCGYSSLNDFRGLGLKHLKPSSEVEFYYYMALINEEKCTRCGKCAASYCPAISMVDGKPVVDGTYCSSCAMCTVICPFDAISIVSR